MNKQVKVKNQICPVETLSEWVNRRIKQIKFALKHAQLHDEEVNLRGRYAELSIILEKINDGRIQEIGKVKFRVKK